MKPQIVLSVRQPWAWLIVNGFKDIENREWSTHYRGELYIHASKKLDSTGYLWVEQHFDVPMPQMAHFEFGGIVGAVELTNCVTHSESSWFEGKFGFVLAHARPLPFIPLRGKLGLFKAELAVEEIVA